MSEIIKVHFYDDQTYNFENIPNNIIKYKNVKFIVKKHKIRDYSENAYENKIREMYKKYSENITNKKLIPYMNTFMIDDIYNNIITFDYRSAIQDKDILFLNNISLEKCIVCFDMDRTLHQSSWILSMNKTCKEYIEYLSTLLNTTITYHDIGELLFGGKDRLIKMRKMFQNLSKTIGIKNVYILTLNDHKYLSVFLSELYSKLFDIPFSKTNIIYTKKTKFDDIKNIVYNSSIH